MAVVAVNTVVRVLRQVPKSPERTVGDGRSSWHRDAKTTGLCGGILRNSLWQSRRDCPTGLRPPASFSAGQSRRAQSAPTRSNCPPSFGRGFPPKPRPFCFAAGHVHLLPFCRWQNGRNIFWASVLATNRGSVGSSPAAARAWPSQTEV